MCIVYTVHAGAGFTKFLMERDIIEVMEKIDVGFQLVFVAAAYTIVLSTHLFYHIYENITLGTQ